MCYSYTFFFFLPFKNLHLMWIETCYVLYSEISLFVLLRCKREEAKITAWENLQKAKAEAAIRKLEVLFVVHMYSLKCFNPSPWSTHFCYVSYEINLHVESSSFKTC